MLRAVAVALALSAAGLLGYQLSLRAGLNGLRDEAYARMQLLSSGVDGEIGRLTPLPGVVALHPAVLDLLRDGGDARRARVVDAYLEHLSEQYVDSLAIFVLDTRGRVVASSDWIYTDNILGANFGYRDYFKTAMAGLACRQFAVDAVRDEPGYFFAQPIFDAAANWKPVGVAVIKVGMAGIERRLLATATHALIIDGNGVVLLAAPAAWRYATMMPMSPARAAVLERQQFEGHHLGPLSFHISPAELAGGGVVRLPDAAIAPLHETGNGFLLTTTRLPGSDWRMVLLSNVERVRAQALLQGLLGAAAAGGLILWVMYGAQRRLVLRARLEASRTLERSNRELERMVELRTQALREAVATLEGEVRERLRAEQTLRAAQDELVQSAKLAVLGRLAAGITHELSQPLAAIRTLAANAVAFMRQGDLGTAQGNLDIVAHQVEQMAGIIQPLKAFARKSPVHLETVDLGRVIDSALVLFAKRIADEGVRVSRSLPQPLAIGDAGRIEQVLVNLIGNALDAMSGVAARELRFATEARDDVVLLRVSDSGPGFAAVRERLFEPFFTTKPPGEGLGLGLAISRDIMRDCGGELYAEGGDGGAAAFVVRLRRAPPETETP